MKAHFLVCFCVLALCLPFATSQADENCFITVEEDTSFSYTCSFNTNKSSISMQVRIQGSFVTVTTCNMATRVCTDEMPGSYKGVVVNSSTIRTDIYSALRDEAQLRCVDENEHASRICDLDVYAWPNTSVCDPVKLDKTGQNLEFTCRTDDVYPSLQGTPVRREVDFGNWDIIGGGCRNDEVVSNSTPATCTWLIAVSNMTAKTYSFYAKLRAFVSDHSKVTESDKISPDVPVVLKAPTTILDNTSCPLGTNIKEGYIMAGSMATCKCIIDYDPDGLTPGRARWYKSDGSLAVPDNAADSSSTLEFKYSPSDRNQAYECRGFSNLMNVSETAGPKYTPVFAYEPASVDIELKSGDQVASVCQGAPATTEFVCTAVVNPDQPEVVFSILVNNKVLIERHEANQSSGYYIYRPVLNHTYGGKKEVTCRAESALFPELSLSKSADVEVREPPWALPVLTVTKSQTDPLSNTVNVTRGTDVEVKCHVDGGHPAVSNVKISCGSTVSVLPGNEGSIKLSVTDSIVGMRCHCSAVHITGCYDKSTEIVLYLADSASLQSLSIIIGIICGALAYILT